MFLPLLAAIGFSAETISFENPGIRLELFLKELSRQVGIEFNCPPFLKNEVLAASFHDQPLETVKTQLARVVHGTWEKKSDGWWLVQTSDQKKEEIKWNLEQRHAFLVKQIDSLRQNAPAKPWEVKDAVKYWSDVSDSRRRTGDGVWSITQRRSLRYRTPQYRLEQRIAEKLDASWFGGDGLAVDLRRFAPNGLKGHVDLPLDPSIALLTYTAELGLLDLINPSWKESTFESMHLDVGGPKIGPATRLEVTIDTGEIPYLSISLYDQNWRRLTSLSPGFDGLNEYLRSSRAIAEPYKMSPETLATAVMLSSTYTAMSGEQAEKDLIESKAYLEAQQVMLHATVRDPLGILEGRCWIDFAHGARKPLLVNISENTEGLSAQNYIPTLSAPSGPKTGEIRIDEGGWVLARPSNPLHNRAWRVDRSCVETLAKLLASPNCERLESQIQIIDLERYVSIYSAGIPHDEILRRNFYVSGDVSLVGCLTQVQFEACAKGAKISIESLPERYRMYVYQMILDGDLGSLVDDVSRNRICPLLSFPKGIEGLSLGIEIQTDLTFEMKDDNGRWFDLDDFAQKYRDGELKPDDQIRWGDRRTMTMSIYRGNKSSEGVVTESLPGGQQYLAWKSVPDTLRRHIAERAKTLADPPSFR